METLTTYIDLSDPIYSQIEASVLKTYTKACIVWMEKNENKVLEQEYLLYALQFVEPNVKRLFHGTKEENMNSILRSGFNPALRKVCACGYGVYFSTRAEYSRHYSKTRSNQDLAYMLVCDVVCGKVAQGRQGLNIPEGYQSFTDNLAHPDMYIVDKREAAYPRYLVAFYPYAK